MNGNWLLINLPIHRLAVVFLGKVSKRLPDHLAVESFLRSRWNRRLVIQKFRAIFSICPTSCAVKIKM